MPTLLAFTHASSLLWPAAFFFLPVPAALLLATLLSLLHFAATWMIFYSQPRLRSSHRGIGLALPLLLFFSFSAWMLAHPDSLSKALVLFFAFVLWHYCKQSFGFFLLSFRGCGKFDDPHSLERQSVMAFFLWAALFGFLSTQMSTGNHLTFGFYVPSLQLPAEPITWIGRAGALAGLAYCAWKCFEYRKPWPFLTALSFYLWVDLRLTDFRFLLLLPAFHALQYLPIVAWRWRGKEKKNWLALGTLALAAAYFAAFHLVPKPQPLAVCMLAAAELTLNLQHYFLDAYIWRLRDAPIREELQA